MLDRTSNTILTDWQPHHEQLFGRHNLCLQHRLHQSPLFTDEVLARLLETVERNDYHVNFQDGPLRREGELGDLSGQDILKAVKQGNIWINLRAPAKANPAYGDLLNDIYDEFENNNPGLRTFKRQLTILISSPKVKVKYHFDVPGQTLWQIRGRKRVWVYPNTSPFITQNGLEKVVLNEAHETDLRYQHWFDDHAAVYDLEPGQMVHWPHNCPHRVENEDVMNVSITTEHWTPALRNAYGVNYANGLMRKVGMRDLPQPKTGLGMYCRLGLAGAVKFSGIRKTQEKPYTINFAVDPATPHGIRDIEPYALQK